jgi:hypothetical protein
MANDEGFRSDEKKHFLNKVFRWPLRAGIRLAQNMDRMSGQKWDPSRLEAGPMLDRMINCACSGANLSGAFPLTPRMRKPASTWHSI